MVLLDFVGSKATSVRNRTLDHAWERRLGICTTGRAEVHQSDAISYVTVAYSTIRRILQRLDLSADDVFVDIGCGKGRVTCCAAMWKLRKVIGVDVDEGLCEIARANAHRMRLRQTAIDIVQCRAEEYVYRDCTRLYLFNPFGPRTLGLVIEAIKRSLDVNPRTIRIAHLHPVSDHVIERAGGFDRIDSWRAKVWGGMKFDVSFWDSRPLVPTRGLGDPSRPAAVRSGQ